jgi:hypothetical protein
MGKTRLLSNLWLTAASLVFSSGLTVFHGVGLDLVHTTAKYEHQTPGRCTMFEPLPEGPSAKRPKYHEAPTITPPIIT